jgi:dolichol-phosphate mannosyltransferase
LLPSAWYQWAVKPRLSVIVPMYNEELVIPIFVDRMRPILDGLSENGHAVPYEVVCVDDGSRDQTAAQLLAARRAWPQLRLVRLLRNAGHQAALTAGLARAQGDFAVTIDADLQDPPEVIPGMFSMVASGQVDVVYGVRGDRSSDTWMKRATATGYYRLMRRLSGPQLPDNAGDFRMVSRRVMDALALLPEQNRVYRLVVPWFGFPSGQVVYRREPRAAGQSKYPLSRMIALGLDSLTAFSVTPLRIATWAGVLGTVFSLFAMTWAVVGSFTGSVVPGWTSLVATVGLLAAVQLLCLGILGEYVARLFLTSQDRPTFMVGYDSLEVDEEPAAMAPSEPHTLRDRPRT